MKPRSWIGVVFTHMDDGTVHMELPTAFLEELLQVVQPFCRDKGFCKLRDAEKLVGKAARIACIVPGARPFVPGL